MKLFFTQPVNREVSLTSGFEGLRQAIKETLIWKAWSAVLVAVNIIHIFKTVLHADLCLEIQAWTFVCAHICLSSYRPCALGPFSPHCAVSTPLGRKTREINYVSCWAEALMLSPGGNAVQSHFPFICCMSFNVYNYLQSHQALHPVSSLRSETSVMLCTTVGLTSTWRESFSCFVLRWEATKTKRKQGIVVKK